MLSYLKKVLIPQSDLWGKSSREIGRKQQDKKVQLATCILFVELANADNQFLREEMEKIFSIMKGTFGDIDEKDIKELIEIAREKIKADESTYEYTTIISENFSNSEKYELLKNLWRLVFADRSMDQYEEHIVKKIGMLINVDYRDIISAKLLVKQELRI
ncbi:MAG TPA: TerB family tellurite resistance protein [Ignavibacteriaceae bacterium]|nr:TerB family tellurite resistance protein [Ignavibacteriaceae bacterium]